MQTKKSMGRPPSRCPCCGQLKPETLLKVSEAMDMISVGRSTLYRLVQSGQIRKIKVGGSSRILKSEIDRIIKKEIKVARKERRKEKERISKALRAEKNKKRNVAHPPKGDPFKTAHCSSCGEEKLVTEFHLSMSQKTGLSAHCKKCVAAKNRLRRLTDSERYVRRLLSKNSGLSPEDFPREMVDTKRLHLQLKRQILKGTGEQDHEENRNSNEHP